MSVAVTASGVKEVVAALGDLALKQVPFATQLALNRTMSDVLKESRKELTQRFDRPTPYTLRAFMGRPATKERPYAEVSLRDDAPSKGTPWRDVLLHNHEGGLRPYRKIEGAFLRLGLLPHGYMIVPGSAAKLNAYGNVPVAFQRTMISYFQGFSADGFRANMSDKRKAKMANKGYHKGHLIKTVGVEYFVSRGRGSIGSRGGIHSRHSGHLAAGIYSRTGTHGSDIKPILMFVRRGSYRKRIDLPKFGKDVVDARFQKHFESALQYAIRTAKLG